jgi:LacI family transcriptional regulator
VIHPSELLYQSPSVLLDCRDAENSLPSVVPDEYLGGYQAAESLINRNHRCIGMINTSEDVPASHLREKGFRQALTDHGISAEDGLIAYGDDGDAKTGYDGVKALFSRYDGMTALFCFNDRVAMGAYGALSDLEKRIPEDVAVIGFDNYDLISANLHPKLTTMQLPHHEMGRWAVETVLQIAQGTGEKGTASQVMLPCPLVMRKSISGKEAS